MYILEDRNIKIDKLEDEVINGGVAGTRKAISVLQSILDMSNNGSSELHDAIKKISDILKTISPRTLNFIATNETYKKQIIEWTNSKTNGGKKQISNTSHHVAGLIAIVEDKLNKSILSAKRIDVKHKREQEKKIVFEFYKSNKNELKKIFDLQNLLIHAKVIANNVK